MTRNLAKKFIDALNAVEDREEIDAIVTLFSNEAVLRRMPQRETHEGLEGVQRFWREYLNDFNGVRTTFHSALEAEEHIILEWESEGTLPNNEPVHYNGVTILVTSGEQILALRTYYDSAVFVPGGATE